MSRNYIDAKTTVWERIYLKDDADMDIIIKQIEEGNIADGFDEEYFDECEPLYETSEYMTIEENNGTHTIEVYVDEKCIWDNVDKHETIVG